MRQGGNFFSDIVLTIIDSVGFGSNPARDGSGLDIELSLILNQLLVTELLEFNIIHFFLLIFLDSLEGDVFLNKTIFDSIAEFLFRS